MNLQQAIARVIEGRDLSRAEMKSVMQMIMTGEATAAQIGGFLVGLRVKGETIDEICGAAEVMRALSARVEVDVPNLVDTCGTGGDARGTFNISTAGALVAAAAGAHVAKHGNRSVSSASGSADVLEDAGVRIDLNPQQVAACIREVGIGFMFAPLHHGAMKHAIGPRKEMAVRTIFNVLGPLTNPAGAPNQLIGVFDDKLVEPLARALAALGSRHVLVVHAADGMDEISIAGPTTVAELKDGAVTTYTVTPEAVGLPLGDAAALAAADSAASLEMIHGVFADREGPATDIVALNAGAALYVAGVCPSLAQGVTRARETIASGAAAEKLARLAEFSHQLD